jgi:hypothetical protein
MTYTWRPASGLDVNAITELTWTIFHEVETIFIPDKLTFKRNLTFAIVNQFFNPNGEIVSIAVDENETILAYTWAKAGEKAVWSDDEILAIRLAHVDPSLSPRVRLKLLTDMLDIWESFAKLANINIISSNTMRKEQKAFLKLHERRGYQIRGSYAYKKM